MSLSELCIRRPVFTTLITATFIVFGIFAYRLLPVAALPAVDFPTISVTATLPGASAENMAVAVAAPIERQMATISGINSIQLAAFKPAFKNGLRVHNPRDLDLGVDAGLDRNARNRRHGAEQIDPNRHLLLDGGNDLNRNSTRGGRLLLRLGRGILRAPNIPRSPVAPFCRNHRSKSEGRSQNHELPSFHANADLGLCPFPDSSGRLAPPIMTLSGRFGQPISGAMYHVSSSSARGVCVKIA